MNRWSGRITSIDHDDVLAFPESIDRIEQFPIYENPLGESLLDIFKPSEKKILRRMKSFLKSIRGRHTLLALKQISEQSLNAEMKGILNSKQIEVLYQKIQFLIALAS